MISMATGVSKLSPFEVIQTLLGMGSSKQHLILFEFRLPRMLLSICIGIGLAVSGCILQGVSRNDLADPGILGINAGAGLAIVLVLLFFGGLGSAPAWLMPIIAFGGAIAAMALVYGLSYKRGHVTSATRLVLTGVGVGSGLLAASTALSLRLSEEQYRLISIWLAGNVWNASWLSVAITVPVIVILFGFVFYKSRVLNAITLGDDMALGLGVNINRQRLLFLLIAALLAGVCVAAGGNIAFVGLIGPHVARSLVGSNHKYLLPTSALCGAILVLLADTLGRIILQPMEVPTGIIVAIIGAPYFLYLLMRAKN
ncbi:iron ABC transporter permease [Culicoidibacter larvae]|uniref:Iron ABC transporter permease n=2 Tax=Culicoidibacter larvae TaxID=2579976 RepID=A0A5R8QHM0_9FIRM|nr:iron ABC transporter permease [Culicoidibacter larvae]